MFGEKYFSRVIRTIDDNYCKTCSFNEIAGIKSFNVFDFLNLEQPVYGAAPIKCFHMLLWKILSY